MPIIILDSHLSTIDKIDYIVNHEDKDTIFTGIQFLYN